MAVSFSDSITIIPSFVDSQPLIDVYDDSPIEEKKEKEYSSHTKFCIYGFSKCRKGTKCIYAHTFKQLNPIICKWDMECLRKEKCYFKHTSETKVQYVKRAFPVDIKRLNIVLYDTDVKPLIKESNEDILDIPDIPDNLIEYTPEQQIENLQRLKESIGMLRLMYYDPIFEFWNWADINEIVDSDDE